MSQSFSEMKSGAEMREYLIGKATDDAEFRARLVADPKKVINEEFGMPLPDGFALSVHEDSSTHVHLVLPPTAGLDPAVLKEVRAAHASHDGEHPGSVCW